MKIGFIAMSGIRACDEELLRLGLTLPGFVERSKTIASLPSLGLLTLAGLTPPGHAAEYHEVLDLKTPGAIPEGIDLVAISSLSAQIGEAYALADAYRARGVAVALGGLHVTALPDEAQLHADAVVVGEGEIAWPRLLTEFERGALQSRYDVRGETYSLADAPMPAFELLDPEKYNRITVQTSRGCPHRCDFCASSVLLTSGYHQKPAEKVLAEIDKIQSIWPEPFIEFADDNSFINRKYWKALLPELAKRRVRWFTETDLSVADDGDLLELMRDAGCAQILIGLESPTTAGLDGMELKRNWKARQLPRYRQAIERIQTHGITVNGCFILGLDGHGPDIFDAVFEFVRDSGLYEVQITVQTPFPGTPLHERLRAEGRMTHDGAWERCTLFDLSYEPQGMSAAELTQGFRDLAMRLYSDEFTSYRRNAYRRSRRGNRTASVG